MKNQIRSQHICSIEELQKINPCETGEALIDVEQAYPEILCNYRRKDATLSKVLVRKTVGDMLQMVQRKLSSYDPSLRLCVVEGYRNPIYQERYFLKQLLTSYANDPSASFDDLLENVHKLVALPSVAGHPTGGAIDLTIFKEGKEMDMGGQIADFSVPLMLPTFSSLVTPDQRINRLLLHDLMIEEGFAPFYGEWWHFSYGDREWAAFYKFPSSLYACI